MTYDEFKTHVTTFLWRQGDSFLAASLDNIIIMAHAYLNRRLDISRRNVTVQITPDSEDYDLPADFRHMRTLVSQQSPVMELKSVTLSKVQYERGLSSAVLRPFYNVDNNVLRLVGPFSVAEDIPLELAYRANVPDFATADPDESWLANDFLDMYTYTVMMHAGIFNKSQRAIAEWKPLADEAIMDAIREDKSGRTYGDSPTMTPHHAVPNRRHHRGR